MNIYKTIVIGLGVIAGYAGNAYADGEELKWSTEGYFRSRGVLLTNLAPQDTRQVVHPALDNPDVTIPEIRRTTYVTHALRIMPKVSYGNIASLTIQVDALDDVLWGDNNGISSSPLLAQGTSNQGFMGEGEIDSINITRAWMQFNVPIGVMRVGRLAAHWGMGLLANGGGTQNADPFVPPQGQPPRKGSDHFMSRDFGEKHRGAVADKALFITKPLTIAKTLMGKKDVESNFIAAYSYGKISEAPLLSAENDDFRPRNQQGFITNGGDDIDEHVFLVAYADPDWDRSSVTDQLFAGVYATYRGSPQGSTNPSALDPGMFCGTFEGEPVPCVDSGSSVWIFDFWHKVRYGPLYSEAEFMWITGKTFGGLPFPAANRKKKANVFGGVWRLGYLTPQWDAELELGHAPGDDEIEDEELKVFPFHPDHNVGLILFDHTLRELSARTFGPPFWSEDNFEGAVGLSSGGGVMNANYIHPKFRYRPKFLPNTELIAAGLFAWVDTKARTGVAMFYEGETGSSYLGTEFDVAIKAQFSEHMHFSLESGVLFFGDVLKTRLTNANNSFTLQSRIGFLW